jgi:peptidoglycan/LPS O-acetylase OafA/YrhL
MHDPDTKRLMAALLMTVLFAGVWLLAGSFRFIIYEDISKVRHFLIMTSFLWAGEVLMGGLPSNKYSFSDHGLQLSILAFVSLITLDATSGLTKYENAELHAALAFAFSMLALTSFLAVKKRHPEHGMPWQWRALSLLAGVLAAESYVLVCLSPEIRQWHL